jgi:DNA-binding transcriptional ArsR family regulator
MKRAPTATTATTAADRLDAFGDVFAALADPNRRLVLNRVAAGEGTATRIARDLPISRQAVVKHLVLLDRAGLVVGRRIGREMRYDARPDRLAAAADGLDAVAASWDRTLAAIKRIAEDPTHPMQEEAQP